MKIWFDRIISNSSYLRIVSNYYRKDDEFQKVKCYTVPEDQIKYKKLNIVKIDDNQVKVNISEQQKFKIINFVNDSVSSYHNREIYLSELDLKNYEKVYNQLAIENKVDKDLLDYIVNDMLRSYNHKGHESNSYTDHFF